MTKIKIESPGIRFAIGSSWAAITIFFLVLGQVTFFGYLDREVFAGAAPYPLRLFLAILFLAVCLSVFYAIAGKSFTELLKRREKKESRGDGT